MENKYILNIQKRVENDVNNLLHKRFKMIN